MQILALALAALIGLALGFLGGGGSILAVPILVYVAGMPAKSAIAASLLVVGITSVLAALRHWRAHNVEWRTAAIFGAVSMIGSYAGGKLAARITDTAQLTLFALVMLAASISMLRSRSEDAVVRKARLSMVIVAAAFVGTLTGVVGVGGGFLIVPALVLFAGVPMKRAVGTSLIVIAMNCASGFAAYARSVHLDWGYTALFTAIAVLGAIAGASVTQSVSQASMKRVFAVFLIVMATFILLHGPMH